MRIRASLVILFVAGVVATVVLILLVRPLTLWDQPSGTQISSVSIGAFLQETSGQRVTTDFQCDYAAALALRHGGDPYEVSAALFDRFGLPAWDVNGPTPHPPTMVTLALPFAFLSYENALSAWAILMVAATMATFALMGVRAAVAVPCGLAVCMTFPGAYGIGNPVMLIGFGVALAYRFRDRPALAALGLALAAAPKISGLALLLPFLLTARWRAVAWTAVYVAVLSAVPMLFFPSTWTRYLAVGVAGIPANAARGDNAALVNLAGKAGLPSWLAVALVLALAVGVALAIRDTFWPTVWLMVALLPVAWMSSLLTFIPLFCAAVRRPNPWSVGAVVLATGLTVASPPLGMWPTAMLPLVVLLAVVAMLQIRETDFWPAAMSHRHRARDAGGGAERRAQGPSRNRPAATTSAEHRDSSPG